MRISVAALFVILFISCAVAAQTESWQKIAPVGHSFTILMPAHAVSSSRQVSTSEFESIPIVDYHCVFKSKRYLAAGFYKSASNIPLLSSFETFIKGINYSFKASAGPESFKFDRDVSAEEVQGKQYHLLLGKYAGVARLLNSSNEYDLLIVIGGDETDPDVARFLGSFRTGQLNTDSDTSGVEGRGGVVFGSASSKTDASPQPSADTDSSRRQVTDKDNELAPNPWPASTGAITGGVLNGRAIHLVQPEYPKSARKNHDAGQIRVQIVIDEVGRVIKAQALNGAESLKEAAVAAALKCQFTATLLAGQPVKVSGVIIYNFVAQ